MFYRKPPHTIMSVADIRRSYDWSELHESSMAESPIAQLDAWINDAITAGAIDPTATTLSTVDANNRPSARIVLLKDYNEDGLVFFTNYLSRKGHDLDANPNASLLFYWPGLERQIRVEGPVVKALDSESDAYYRSRPLASRISAWASPQSEAISRDDLDARMARYSESLGESPERPPFWGGYRLKPIYFEFWQGRANRLHDRLAYTLDSSQRWTRSRLAP